MCIRDRLKVRQPLQSVTLKTPKGIVFPRELVADYASLIQDELNVKEVIIEEGTESQSEALYDMTITEVLKNEGDARELVRSIQQERQKMGLKQSDKIHLTVPEIPDGFSDYISQKVLAASLAEGSELKIEKV